MSAVSAVNATEIAPKRIAYLDIARSIAIVSISCNHAVNRSFATYFNQYAEFLSLPLGLTVIKTVIYAFSRIGVPLFLMISGALLLKRDYSGDRLGRFIKHNWLQLLIVTEIWLAIMFWYKQLLPDSLLDSQGIGYCFVKFVMTLLFINPETMGSMWYMEMILCVYLLIPILATALKHIDHRFFIIPSAIVVICSFVLPDVNGFLNSLGIEGTLATKLESANVFSMYVVYLLLGYFISNDVLGRFKASAVIAAAGLGFGAFCAFQFWFYARPYDFCVANGYMSIFPLLASVPLFELLRRCQPHGDGRFVRVTHELAVISFGVYFVHICIMEGLFALITTYGWDITYLARFLFLEIVSFVGAALIVDVCRKSKVLATYLFGIK